MGAEQYGSDKGYIHYITRVDEDSVVPNTYYIGDAKPRSAAASAVWRICKIVVTSPAGVDSVQIFWANGDDRFDNIWDNRQSLSYT